MIAEQAVERERRARGNIALGLCRESQQPETDGAKGAGRAAILQILHRQTSHDFSQYKKSAVLRGIHSRMAATGTQSTGDYADLLEMQPEEATALLDNLLINVTQFFRDPEAFAALKQDALPPLLRDRPPEYLFRAWAPGCSTGEEAYSLAILLQEIAHEMQRPCSARIFADDIDEHAIASALAGTFSLRIARDGLAPRLRRFFTEEPHRFRVNEELRSMVAFNVRNVAHDCCFDGLDLISCRNLLIYLEPGLQAVLLTTFHRALRPGGVLFLSPSESIGDATDLFTPISRKWKLYRANSCGSLGDCGRFAATRQSTHS